MSNPEFKTESFIGSGKFYLDGRRLGNCSEAKLSYSIDTKTLPNFEGGGGNLDSIDKITGVALDLTCFNWSAQNIAMALAATVGEETAGAVTGEAHKMAKHTLVDTAFMIDVSQPVLVKTVTPAATLNPVDANGKPNYEITPAGVVFLGGNDVKDDTAITIDYKKAPHYLVQALLATGKEFKLIMDGMNDANGKPVTVRVWRFKPAPSDGMNLISDDFASFTVKGQVLADVSKAQGKSQFFEIAKAMAA
jgi:hypothetical protein